MDPIIVHCSAGIGRTGVLILMETAECLIEANQPVYPLDIVSVMRSQRPLMIQTSVRLKNLCTLYHLCTKKKWKLEIKWLRLVDHDDDFLMIVFQSQYRFVCEAVLKVYQTGKIRPNPEFCLPTTTSLSPLSVPTSGGSPTTRNFASWFTSAKIFN